MFCEIWPFVIEKGRGPIGGDTYCLAIYAICSSSGMKPDLRIRRETRFSSILDG